MVSPRLFLACFLATAVFAHGADWPEFLGPNRDGTSPETGLLEKIPATGVPRLWSREVGTGYGAPSVRGGLLVLHHRIGNEEIVEAMDAASGETRWKHPYASSFIDPFGYNNGPRCTPLLTADRCYTFGAEGVLLCLELQTGRVVWRRDTQADFNIPEAFFGVGSSPILEGGLLIAMLGGQPNSGVVAFDAATGQTVWENVGEKSWTGVPMTGWPGERTVRWNPADPAFQKQASYCTPVAATIHGRRMILCCMRQGLTALDAKSGEALFSFWFRSRRDESVNAMTPVVSGEHIFISSAYYKTGSVLLKVRPDARGVEEVWRGLQMEMHWPQAILHEGHLFGFSGRNEPDASFRCVEWASGQMKWERSEAWQNSRGAPPDRFGRASLILADGKFIALGEAGLLGLFLPDAAEVREAGRWQIPGAEFPCWAGPVLSEKRLYVRSEERLFCFDFQRR